MRDFRSGLHMYRLPLTLGWLDVKLRYRGSRLGPFWLTISTGIMILSMGVLYAELFKLDVKQYLPYLGVSIVLWNAMSGMVGEGCSTFTSADGTIRSMRMPFMVHALRVVIRNILVSAHHAVVVVCLFLYFDEWPGKAGFVSLVGAGIWLVDALATCMLLGSFCARFRDVPPIVASILQVAFFITPVIWQPQALGSKIVYLVANPFYPLLAIVRDPLLGHPPGGLIWTTALAWSALLWAASLFMFVRVRNRLAFWV